MLELGWVGRCVVLCGCVVPPNCRLSVDAQMTLKFIWGVGPGVSIDQCCACLNECGVGVHCVDGLENVEYLEI